MHEDDVEGNYKLNLEFRKDGFSPSLGEPSRGGRSQAGVGAEPGTEAKTCCDC
jgi:hypothetical protein